MLLCYRSAVAFARVAQCLLRNSFCQLVTLPSGHVCVKPVARSKHGSLCFHLLSPSRKPPAADERLLGIPNLWHSRRSHLVLRTRRQVACTECSGRIGSPFDDDYCFVSRDAAGPLCKKECRSDSKKKPNNRRVTRRTSFILLTFSEILAARSRFYVSACKVHMTTDKILAALFLAARSRQEE